MAFIHIVDDDPLLRDSLCDFLNSVGHDIAAFETAEDAQAVISKDTPDVILLDLKLPGMDGIEYLEYVKKNFTDIEVIMITGYADVSSAVKAMKLGAWDYIRKPFDIEEIGLVVQKALESKKREEQLAYLQQESQFEFKELVGESKPMQEVFSFISQVAGSPKTTVLIRGETGTGKELVARAIHFNSPRADKPFIEINCSAFQESLLESELFGYEQGAFTGARQRKKGLLELANEGIFFLDEIGDMSTELQAKLLKVIEEQTFRRVGGTKEIKIDIRIISASSRDLMKAIADGTFREELFYRLNVAAIELPPLRERGEDVILLSEHFLSLFNTEFKRNIKDLNPDVKSFLLQHSWPGNVRELRNVIERAVLFEKGDYLSLDSVRLFDKPLHREMEITSIQEGFLDIPIPPGGLSLPAVEKQLIERALKQSGGNITQAAKLLCITREKLRYRIKKLGVSKT